MYKAGDFVTINNRSGVVAKTGAELVAETGANLGDHTGVWFGTYENGKPEIWTIPTEYLEPGPAPVFKH